MTIPFTSVYESLTVTIDGATYPVRRLNRQRTHELGALHSKMQTANEQETLEIGYEEVALLVDAPKDVIDGLDLKQIRDITRYLTKALFGGEEAKAAGDPEKNGPRPGDETPQG